MHEKEPSDNERQDNQEEGERERETQPRIYVASLSDYNEGRLHGAWIDAAQSKEELAEVVADMLERSPSPCAEEWAIHDYEGFGPLRLDEFESFEVVARVAAGIARHGAAFAAFAEHVGADSDLLDGFEDAYVGEYESGEAFAEEMLDESGVIDAALRQLPEDLRPYVRIDHEAYFDDLVASGYISAVEKHDGGVYIFRIP